MLVIKVSGETIGGVLESRKYALVKQAPPSRSNWKAGDLVLISLNVESIQPSEKQIRWIAELIDVRKAHEGEVEKIWQVDDHKWVKIMELANLREISRPFNLKDQDVLGDEFNDDNYNQRSNVLLIRPDHIEKIRVRLFETNDL